MSSAFEDRAMSAVAEPGSERVLFGAGALNAVAGVVSPEKLLVVRAVVAPENAFLHALIASAGAACGAFVGYALGYLTYLTVLPFLGGMGFWLEYFPQAQLVFREFMPIIVGAGAFAPIPFAFLTFTSGFFTANIVIFMLVAALVRAARYMLLTWLVWRGGVRTKEWVERNFYGMTMALAVGMMLLAVLVKYLLGRF